MVVTGDGRKGTEEPLFGREELLDEARRLIERVRRGEGGALLLTGPGGVGKSHALRAVVGLAADFQVFTGRALPEELPAPFRVIGELFHSPGADRTAAELASPSPSFPVLLPAFPETLAPAAPTIAESTESEELERLLAPLGRTAIEGLGAGREEMLGRLVENFRELTRAAPVLLSIDDLQFADASSLELLRRLARELGSMPFAAVATVAVDGPAADGARETISEIAGLPGVLSRAVRPLSVGEAPEFVRWVLGGREPSGADVLRWHAQTEGNPLFIEQLVRAEVGARARSGAAAPTGKDVVEILLGRVRTLGEPDRRLLTYCAALGKEVAFPVLSAVAGMEEERVTEGLDHLVHAGLLRGTGGEVYEFVSEGVRAHVYADLTETRRRILHRKIGQALAALGTANVGELARQFYLGRDDARAVEYNLRAAEVAIRAFAFETAVAHLARALEAERRRPHRDPRTEVRLLTEEGRLLDELGALLRSEALLLDAVDKARAHGALDLELGRALLGLAQTRCDRSELASAEALAGEAMHLLETAGHPRDRFAAHRTLGVVFWRRGDLPAAESHQRAALEIAETEGTPLELGHALVDVANTMVPLGEARFEPALELYSRAAQLFGTVEEYGARARVLMNTAVLEYGAGRTEAAFRDIQVAIAAAERSRSPIWVGYCHLNLAQWHAEAGRPGPARAALERAVQAFRPLGDRLADQQIAMTRGMIALAEGAFAAAESSLEEALARARELRVAPEVSEVLLRLGELAERRGDVRGALARLREAESSGLLEHRPDFRPRHAALAAALGQTDGP